MSAAATSVARWGALLQATKVCKEVLHCPLSYTHDHAYQKTIDVLLWRSILNDQMNDFRNFLFFFISSFTSGQSRGLRKLSRLMNAERNLHHKKQQNMTSQEHFWVLLKLYVTPSNDFWTLSTKIMQSVRNHPIHTTIPVAKHAATPPWQSLQMSQQMSPHRKVHHLPLWVVPWVEGKITRSSEVVVCQRLLQCWEGLWNKKKKSNTRWTCMYCFMFEWVDESRVLHTAECSQAPTNIVTSLIPRLFSLSEHKMWSGNETIVQTDVFTTEASH